MREDALRHRASADVAVADEKYFYHYIFPPEMLDFTVFSALSTVLLYFCDSVFVHLFEHILE